jgi:hypothetical protein
VDYDSLAPAGSGTAFVGGAALDAEVEEEELETLAGDEAEPRGLVGAGVGGGDEPRKAAAKPRSRAGAWVGGTVLGAVLGGGALFGSWLYGVEPPATWREALGKPPTKDPAQEKLLSSANDRTRKESERAEKAEKDAEKAVKDAEDLKKQLAEAKKNAGSSELVKKIEKDLRAAQGQVAELQNANKLADNALKQARNTANEAKAAQQAAEKEVGTQKMLAKKAMDEAADRQTKLVAAMKEIDDQKKLVEAAMKEAVANKDLAAKAAADKKAADDALSGVVKELIGADFLKQGADPKMALEGVKEAIKTAKTLDRDGQLRNLQGQIAQKDAELKQRRQPKEMLPVWLGALQDRDRKDLAADAVKDADRVLTDKAASAAEKARAQVVKGLALRNQGKYAEARQALEQGKAALGTGAPALLAAVETALSEARDPAASFARRAEELQRRGKAAEAVELLDKARAAMPAGPAQARLLAERGLLQLEAARAAARGGRLAPEDARVVAALKDAAEAIKGKAAHGYYAAGRIHEELGQWDLALKDYRQAVAAEKGLEGVGSLYRIALARVLVKARQEKVSRAAPPLPDTLELTVLMLALTLQPPALDANQEEAQRLADEVLAIPADKVPFEVRAQALALKGLHNEALQTYVKGLEPLLSRDQAEGLMSLIKNHPGMKRPEIQSVPDPFEAERRYTVGQGQYFDRRYADAEKNFLAAIRSYGQDARYFYYLGLTQLAQNKPEARLAFQQGAILERENRPARDQVSKALERVQGAVRRILNEARDKP